MFNWWLMCIHSLRKCPVGFKVLSVPDSAGLCASTVWIDVVAASYTHQKKQNACLWKMALNPGGSHDNVVSTCAKSCGFDCVASWNVLLWLLNRNRTSGTVHFNGSREEAWLFFNKWSCIFKGTSKDEQTWKHRSFFQWHLLIWPLSFHSPDKTWSCWWTCRLAIFRFHTFITRSYYICCSLDRFGC